MSLTSLPVEILQLICHFMAEKSYLYKISEELANLAICCRSLYAVALPYVYRTVNAGPRHTFLLVRSISEKPSLAPYIRDVTITPRRPESGGDTNLGKAYTLLRKPGLLPKALTRHLHPKDSNAILLLLIEILLLQVIQVEELSINVTTISTDAKLFDRKRWRSGNLLLPARLYLNLKRLNVYVHLTYEEERDIIGQMRNLITLSQPQRLSIEVPHPLVYTCPELKLPNLQTLDIDCEGMAPWALEELLEGCPNVRSVSYSGGSGPEVWHPMFDNVMNVRELCQVLQARKHSLHALGIHLYYPDDSLVSHEDTISNLSQWSQLKKLELDMEALEFVIPGETVDPLEGVKVRFLYKFPRSLEIVRIFRADERHLQELKDLARRKAQDFPNMRSLILEWWNGETPDPPTDLGTDLLAAGINLILV